MINYVRVYNDYYRLLKNRSCSADSQQARIVKAIDKAIIDIGKDIISNEIRENLRKAVWLSCIDRSKYNFDAFAGTIGYEKRRFDYYKNEFLYKIKTNLGM